MSNQSIDQVMDRVLSNIVLFKLDVKTITANKKMLKTDIQVDETKLPPEDLASLGNFKVFGNKEIKIFKTILGKAEDRLLKVGTRFMGGYAVPKDLAQEAYDDLMKLKPLYYNEKADFFSKFDENLERHYKNNPKWESVLRTKQLDKFRLENHLQYGVGVVEVNPVPGLDDGIKEEVKGLKAQIYQEVAVKAKVVWENSLKGQAIKNQKIKSPFKAICKKLDALKMVDSQICHVIDHINQTLNDLPLGPIQGSDLQSLVALTSLLMDKDKLKDYGQIISDQNSSIEAQIEVQETETFEETIIEPVDPVEIIKIPVVSLKEEVIEEIEDDIEEEIEIIPAKVVEDQGIFF